MRRNKYKYLILVAAFAAVYFLTSGSEAHSFSSGAPAGYCNSPSSMSTCHTCHNTGPTPSTIPGLISSNIPVSGYVPGSTYTVTATVSAVGHNRFGFEISPQDINGNLLGTMNDLSNETTFQQAGVYITHSSTSLLSNDSKTWQFEWIAPQAGTGNVTFYGAFNITNNDGSYTGDTIVLSTTTYSEDVGLFISSANGSSFASRSWINESILFIGRLPEKTRYVSLVDCSGNTCWKAEADQSQSDQTPAQFNLPVSLPVGVYVVCIETATETFASKIMTVH